MLQHQRRQTLARDAVAGRRAFGDGPDGLDGQRAGTVADIAANKTFKTFKF